jgi:hypothetical protein
VHPNKQQGGDAIYRTGNSIAVPAASRSALLLARDPDDPEGEQGLRRVLAHFKCNLAPLAPSQLFEIETVELPALHGIPATSSARLRHLGDSAYTARELLTTKPSQPGAVDEAETFLLDLLREGREIDARVVKAQGQRNGHADKTLERAAKRLGIVKERHGFGRGGVWTWRLPTEAP